VDEPPVLSSTTVLLVEPPADDRAMYAAYLRELGFAAVEQDNPDEAFRQAAGADLVVTGIGLRERADGLTLVERLRRHEATRRLPIIVLSACAFDEDRDRALAAGCDTFLAKPCPPERLASEARRLLRSVTPIPDP
jgi:CheY-like chemotaxis protein